MHKEYYFISGLPRSGSTLLSSILRQNPNFYSDILSPVEILTTKCIDVITFSDNNLQINDENRKNLMYGVFDGYYRHIDNPIIFDSCRLWTKRTRFLKSLFPYTKILCCVRNILPILNSFEIISSKNPFYSKTYTKSSDSYSNIFTRCDEMMHPSGIIGEPLISLQEGYASNPEMIYFVEYENLCINPEETLKNIYNFLGKPYYPHDFENVGYSNELFDRYNNLENLHTVRKKVEYNPPKFILPPDIIKKYQNMNMEFWKEANNFFTFKY